MPIYVASNIPSERAQRYLGIAQRSLNTTLERLASGKRINSAQDDPAGLLMSNRLTRAVQAWDQGASNMRMGLDLLQTADSFMTIIEEDLLRMDELARESMNGLLTDDERNLLNKEFTEIIPEITRLTENTKYLGQTLFTGLSVSLVAGEGAGNVVTVMINGMTTGAAGGLSITSLTIGTFSQASVAVGVLSAQAFPLLTSVIAQIGAQANAFTKSVDATDALVENLTAGRDRILLADLAQETTNLTNNQIIVQSGISALVQANSAQTLALGLLGSA
ncbi:MAG: hypothetical protein GF333_05235 [Candidatus Omnitrophica bacterium]|nr:hypothetical protein [Candidatus Omnitrophota bacterium]